MAGPHSEVAGINEFLGGGLEVGEMIAAIDRSL
jgi:hypothetical protein